MARSPEELRGLSLQLLAHSIELRRAAEIARRQAIHCQGTALAAQARTETSRIQAGASRKRQDDR